MTACTTPRPAHDRARALLLAAMFLAPHPWGARIAPVAAQADPTGRPRSTALEPSFVAATRAFEFHSDPRLNLHDFLYSRVRADTTDAHGRAAAATDRRERDAACLQGLDAAARLGWRDAEATYAAIMDRHHREAGAVALRYALLGTDAGPALPDSMRAVLAALDAAEAAYRACWWPEHDARNRDWIAAAAPLAIRYEDALMSRLAHDFGATWPARLRVDVVGWASPGGANTVAHPDHIMISSADPAYRGHAALEMLFHEASHTIVSGGSGAIAEAIRAASEATGRPAPGILWHVLLFHAAGYETRRLLAEHGEQGYYPYLYAQGLYRRAWPDMRGAVERHWEPYLRGETELAEAVRRIVAELGDAG